MESQEEADRSFETDAEVTEVVRKFESCEFGPDEFNHREHLCVALVYALRFDEREARERTRAGILKFLSHHGIDPASVYHETITVFWLRRVRAFVERAGRERTLGDLAGELLAACGNSRVIFDYYSRELLDSETARADRIEPDLKPFDF